MKVSDSHLTYCMNVHPVSSSQELKEAVEKYVVEVKKVVCPNEPMGVGVWLSDAVSKEIILCKEEWKTFFSDRGLYVFTMNGFPYGVFHETRVKENVYIPNWGDEKRLAYTLRLAEILACFLPDGVSGSISTVPIAYGKTLPLGAVSLLKKCAQWLCDIEKRTGKRIVLALELEPDCFLEKTSDVEKFWKENFKPSDSEKKYIGICLDTCHFAMQFESPTFALRRFCELNILVPKIQLSAALYIEEEKSKNSVELLTPFIDSVYLHQTRVKTAQGVLKYADLPEALLDEPSGMWCVHYHIPLNYKGVSGLKSTLNILDEGFWKEAFSKPRHFEIETYTFDVMPCENKGNIVSSIIGEWKYVIKNLKSYIMKS